MHIPSKFKETDLDTLYQFIEDYPLGALISSEGGNIDADHIPFYLNKPDVSEVILQSHIARANNLWRKCSDGQEVLLIFHGPNAYVSPNFYPSKKETGRVVPTWNYSVVHVKGHIYFKHESQWILQLLRHISDFHEVASQANPWSVTDAPEDFIDKLINAVVGLEVKVDHIIGKFKLSQDKKNEDFSGVVDGLSSSSKALEHAVAKQMKQEKV